MNNALMQIAVSETAHVFRVNGITVAKRHLAKTLGEGRKISQIDERILAKYLVIVPFLAKGFVPPDKASESVRYGYVKAKRLYDAIGLTDETIGGFMMVFLQLAELGHPEDGAITNLSSEMRAAGFYDDFYDGKPSFQPGNRHSPSKTRH